MALMQSGSERRWRVVNRTSLGLLGSSGVPASPDGFDCLVFNATPTATATGTAAHKAYLSFFLRAWDYPGHDGSVM